MCVGEERKRERDREKEREIEIVVNVYKELCLSQKPDKKPSARYGILPPKLLIRGVLEIPPKLQANAIALTCLLDPVFEDTAHCSLDVEKLSQY